MPRRDAVGRSAPVALMWKTVAEDCNLACTYCYYGGDGGFARRRQERIDDALLERTIAQAIARAQGVATFVWQGGEPLIAGRAFFDKVVELQARHARPGVAVRNALQTNGTLIDDAWAAFFARHGFLVGVSLDGPREVNDSRRVTTGGAGTYDLVMRRIAHLVAHRVDFNVLAVLHEGNVGRARELVDFFVANGLRYVQFIPGMAFRATDPGAAPDYLITPAQYGAFLREAFDAWYGDGRPRLSIGLFDSLLAVCAGHPPTTCTLARECSRTLVAEPNGDVYPCDFYLAPAYKLGNLARDSIDEVIASQACASFRRLKPELAPACRACPHVELCFGGCPRNRPKDGGRDLFCAAYRELFDHARERLQRMADALRRRNLASFAQSGEAWPDRNDRCFCGSGRKFKQCCGPLRDSFAGAGRLPPTRRDRRGDPAV